MSLGIFPATNLTERNIVSISASGRTDGFVCDIKPFALKTQQSSKDVAASKATVRDVVRGTQQFPAYAMAEAGRRYGASDVLKRDLGTRHQQLAAQIRAGDHLSIEGIEEKIAAAPSPKFLRDLSAPTFAFANAQFNQQ